MAQYETGARTPKTDLTNALANALDILGKNKNKYTETLCSDILRIYELLKIAGITRAQAKELIGGLITFAVGQGIDIK